MVTSSTSILCRLFCVLCRCVVGVLSLVLCSCVCCGVVFVVAALLVLIIVDNFNVFLCFLTIVVVAECP